MFRLINDKGFQITFANGLEASVVFGVGNYCEKRHEASAPGEDRQTKTAEFACFAGPRTIFADGQNGTGCCGWLSPDTIAAYIGIVSNHKVEDGDDELVRKLREAY